MGLRSDNTKRGQPGQPRAAGGLDWGETSCCWFGRSLGSSSKSRWTAPVRRVAWVDSRIAVLSPSRAQHKQGLRARESEAPHRKRSLVTSQKPATLPHGFRRAAVGCVSFPAAPRRQFCPHRQGSLLSINPRSRRAGEQPATAAAVLNPQDGVLAVVFRTLLPPHQLPASHQTHIPKPPLGAVQSNAHTLASKGALHRRREVFEKSLSCVAAHTTGQSPTWARAFTVTSTSTRSQHHKHPRSMVISCH